MSQSYGKSHYTWTAPSTQSSESIIKSSDDGGGTGHAKTSSTRATQEKPSTIPVIPRRSSYNYEQDSVRFSNLGSNPPAGKPAEAKEKTESRGDLFHSRKKSYTMEDQKRTQHEFMLRNDDKPQSFSEV
ncbi:hypothetical protein Q9L58_002792 [Maublancomyces gigas]|uniref:Uncharacterized protein n=1 Tax=Discina gigas TaxID=1032678 RepID=A0ABR3GQH1_9PEZI